MTTSVYPRTSIQHLFITKDPHLTLEFIKDQTLLSDFLPNTLLYSLHSLDIYDIALRGRFAFLMHIFSLNSHKTLGPKGPKASKEYFSAKGLFALLR